MTSRFFAASDSSSDDSSEEELYSGGESEAEKSEGESDSDDMDSDDDDDSDSDGSAVGANRFLKDDTDEESEEEEEGAKVLKSAKDKRFQELEGTVRSIENAEKINDWSVISDRKSAHHLGGVECGAVARRDV
jgi:translation initiation factor 3 subunit C